MDKVKRSKTLFNTPIKWTKIPCETGLTVLLTQAFILYSLKELDSEQVEDTFLKIPGRLQESFVAVGDTEGASPGKKKRVTKN